MRDLRVLGVTWGDPHSAFTYSGVPWHLFAELERRSILVGRADAKQVRTSDVFRGALDVRRSIHARHPVRNALWRYFPENIERLTSRYAKVETALPDHDVSLQFGVAGIPRRGRLVAHIEIPVQTAASSAVFAQSYGFDRVDDRMIARAAEGQLEFMDACSVVWTNSAWTATQLRLAGCQPNKLRWQPPGCGAEDPGEIDRDWSRCSILFLGKDWRGKGGPQLIEAFRLVRAARPDAQLTIIGCTPDVDSEPGVNVVGFLHKERHEDMARLDACLRDATIFCLPSLWESTGVVYMEAALYGLPVIMVAGQGREKIFTASGSLTLDDPDPERIAQAIQELSVDPQRMQSMGESGRRDVLDRYTWEHVAGRVATFLEEAAQPVL